MSLDNLPTYELGQAAQAEAAAFVLPEDWRVGRGTRSAFAIDQPYSPDIDDAVAYSRLGDGGVLHVSIADTGSFLHEQVAISRYARRRTQSKYIGNRVVSPMIPREVSEDKLSLLDGVERPVLTIHVPVDANGRYSMPKITRDVLRARRLTYAEVESRIEEDGPTGTALRGLERVACLLFTARHSGEIDPEDAMLEDEEGNILESDEYDTGRLIVQESMIVAGAAMPLFMRAHSIPGLYRNHVIPEDMLPEVTNPRERAQLLRSLARAGYGTEPKGHAGLNFLPAYMHVTSPIRRFPDFANHANVAAFLDGREYPYPEDRLQRIADRLQALALKDAEGRADRRPQKTRGERGAGPILSPYRRPKYLLDKFADGTAGPGELATALFNAVGSDEELSSVRAAAARYAAAHIHHARPALDVALARKLLTLRAAQPADEVPPRTKFVVEDQGGNVYPYLVGKSPLALAVSSATVIGGIGRVEVEPVIPANKTREGKILHESFYYLRKLADENRFQLIIQTHEEDGSAYAGLVIILDGVRHVAAVNTTSKKQALREAGADLIRRLDLIDNPPPVRIPPTWQERAGLEADPKLNPISMLQARQMTAGIDPVEYSFPDIEVVEEGEPIRHLCRASAFDVDGRPYVVVAEGASKKEAKQRAAGELFAEMPSRPLNKKGRMAPEAARAE